MANWFREGEWLPIASLAPSYDGPVVLIDETKTIQWFSERPSKAAVEHREHKLDEDGVTYLYNGPDPLMESRKVKPAFWALARMVD